MRLIKLHMTNPVNHHNATQFLHLEFESVTTSNQVIGKNVLLKIRWQIFPKCRVSITQCLNNFQNFIEITSYPKHSTSTTGQFLTRWQAGISRFLSNVQNFVVGNKLFVTRYLNNLRTVLRCWESISQYLDDLQKFVEISYSNVITLHRAHLFASAVYLPCPGT